MGGKTKTKNEPWAPAQPYILKGMQQTGATYDENQPRLQDMSTEAYNAFKSISPEAFQASPFVRSAQSSAQALGGGALLGANPGQATYDRLSATAKPIVGGGGTRDPSMGLLASLTQLTQGGTNPADRFATAAAQGKYLNAQPSADLYGRVMSQDYLTGNPYLQSIIDQTNANVKRDANRLFASRGMGAGIGSTFADVLSNNLAQNEGALRYQNYNDASNRQLQAAGQSDAAFSSERDRMGQANSLLASNYNAGQDRILSAAQALGSQFNAGQDRALDAARASDAAQQSQVQQMLTALGLTGELRNAEFAGIGPALSLLNTAADIPYVGTAALNGQIRQASNGYGTTTQSGGLGTQLLAAGTQLGSAYLGRGG